MKVRLELEGQLREVDITLHDGTARALVDGKTIELDATRVPGGWLLKMGHRVYDIVVSHGKDPAIAKSGHEVQLAQGSLRTFATIPEDEGARKKAGASGSAKTLKAPMPGRVVRLLVQVGDVVKTGQPLIVLEAMKMENELRASGEGTVREVHVREGASIERGAALIAFA